MASHNAGGGGGGGGEQAAGTNDGASNNQPSTIPELLKILPKRETKLQVRMAPPPAFDGSSKAPGNIRLSNHNHRNNNNNNHHHNNNSNHQRNSNHNNNSISNNNNKPQFHTLRYDFKPASVNSEEPASIELTPTGQVTIRAPNFSGSSSSHTVFRGQRRPHIKECLLVIDNNTGEMILQKLTDNFTVKATRSIGNGSSSTSGNAYNSDTTPMINGTSSSSTSNNFQSNTSTSQDHHNNTNTNSTNTTSTNSTTAPTINTNTTNTTTTTAHINHNNNNHSSSQPVSETFAASKSDGPQLSEDSSSSSDSSSGSRSRSSSSSSSSSSSLSSNSSNSSPDNDGFRF